jgi:hypothetical protein
MLSNATAGTTPCGKQMYTYMCTFTKKGFMETIQLVENGEFKVFNIVFGYERNLSSPFLTLNGIQSIEFPKAETIEQHEKWTTDIVYILLKESPLMYEKEETEKELVDSIREMWKF